MSEVDGSRITSFSPTTACDEVFRLPLISAFRKPFGDTAFDFLAYRHLLLGCIRGVGYNFIQVIHMKLFRTKTWNWWDISILKWCCFLFGVAAGAYLHDYVMSHLGIVLVAAILLTIRPAIAYGKE
jgi:hypothetical protein